MHSLRCRRVSFLGSYDREYKVWNLTNPYMPIVTFRRGEYFFLSFFIFVWFLFFMLLNILFCT